MDGGSLGDLFSGTPREILERLADGDPLELAPRTEERLAERALLMDFDRILPRAFAQVAYRARARGAADGLERFLRRAIDLAIEDSLQEDREEERRGLVPAAGSAEHQIAVRRYSFLARTLGLELPQARRACVRFNDLPPVVRRAYFALCVRRRPLEDCVAEGLGTRRELERRLRRALEALAVPFDERELLEDRGEEGP